jgi:hypothetical protein
MLRRGYPQKTALQMVATRYGLSSEERSVLFRGVMEEEQSAGRREKLLTKLPEAVQAMHIDTANVLFTIAAYLRGKLIYIADDGWIRDASELHRMPGTEIKTMDAVNLLMKTNMLPCPREIILYTDEKLDGMDEIADALKGKSPLGSSPARLIRADSADHGLYELKSGVIATSDSIIIDRADVPLFDLARYILEFHFEPDFLDIRKIQ